MKVKDFEPLYTVIEPIRVKDPGSYFHSMDLLKVLRLLDYSVPIMKWEKFRKKYGDCYIYSIRDFEDTKSTSIMFGNVDMGAEPAMSVHEVNGDITWKNKNHMED